MTGSPRVVSLGLGSNLGDRGANLIEAMQSLRAHVHIEHVFSVHETEPAYRSDASPTWRSRGTLPCPRTTCSSS